MVTVFGDVREVGEATEGDSGRVSSSNLRWTASVSWFRVSPPSPHKNAFLGGLYIGVVRSS
jgi:hypothetical protein